MNFTKFRNLSHATKKKCMFFSRFFMWRYKNKRKMLFKNKLQIINIRLRIMKCEIVLAANHLCCFTTGIDCNRKTAGGHKPVTGKIQSAYAF